MRSHHPFRFARAAAWLAAGALLYACSDPSSPGASEEVPAVRYAPGIHVLAAPADGDTVDAVPDQALRLRIVGADSLPIARSGVSVEATRALDRVPGASQLVPMILVGRIDGATFDDLITVTTDSSGIAHVRLRMGMVAGEAWLRLRVPGRGLVDSLRVTISAGAPARIRLLPADTAVLRGGAFAVDGGVLDRWWNEVPRPLSFEASPGLVVEGDSVRGTEFGRHKVFASIGTLRDSALVSVVPEWTLSAFQPPTTTGPFEGPDPGIVIFRTDGAEFRHFPGAWGQTVYQAFPAWHPAGGRLISNGAWDGSTLLTTTTEGVFNGVPVTSDSELLHAFPEYSRDGQWIFFAGGGWNGQSALYRVPAQGGSAELIGEDVDLYQRDSRPAASPDGRWLAFTTNRVTLHHGGSTIRMLDLETGAVDSMDVAGDAPRWSPDGSRIAFTRDGAIHLMQPDGSYLGIVSTREEYAWLDWSPDGQWLVATGIEYYQERWHMTDLIRVEDGLRIPLPFGRRIRFARFRPE